MQEVQFLLNDEQMKQLGNTSSKQCESSTTRYCD